jgi:hypothetical protein
MYFFKRSVRGLYPSFSLEWLEFIKATKKLLYLEKETNRVIDEALSIGLP